VKTSNFSGGYKLKAVAKNLHSKAPVSLYILHVLGVAKAETVLF
jgi:hypothetical protein